ncbi:protein SRC2 homolog [Ziziphus jujuba]|uniref:Protein SRC2 homolog n=2 Tax=Ziziphus jujuba TaxID=326968 RepID=A0A6P4ARW5_ZIZJJ|nr:protein SRC2 homolog [Ziziphus jujuba]KAH7517099.1 hypothetical protein FEM48_Zijuj09G0026500 [Ziziphus jujuba var. spinosa]
MQCRALEITVISARDLKKVKHLTKMDVYVVVSLPGGSHTEQKTPVDKDGGTSPNWNFPMKFNIDEAEARKNRHTLTFKVKCNRRLHSDKEIGEVNVPIEELLDNGGDGKFVKYVTYKVRKTSGKLTGDLNLSYKFADRVVETTSSSSTKVDDPAIAYPADGRVHHRPPGYPVPEFPPAGFTIAGGLGGGPEPPVGYPVYGLAAEYVPNKVMGFGYAPLVKPQLLQPADNKPELDSVDPALLNAILSGLLINGMVTDQAAASDSLYQSANEDASDCL